jgi:hypothetical protein
VTASGEDDDDDGGRRVIREDPIKDCAKVAAAAAADARHRCVDVENQLTASQG